MLIRVDGSNGCKTLDMHKRACASNTNSTYWIVGNLKYLMRDNSGTFAVHFKFFKSSVGEIASCSVALEVHQESAIPCVRARNESLRLDQVIMMTHVETSLLIEFSLNSLLSPKFDCNRIISVYPPSICHRRSKALHSP